MPRKSVKTDDDKHFYKIKIRSKFKNQKQRELSDIIKENRITFVTGSPGTGKSFIALKTGLELLKNNFMGNILLTTPIVEVANKSLGALPGDINQKISHYFQHFYDNIEKIIDKDSIKYINENRLIKEKVVNFIRGATFGDIDQDGNPIGTYCILDECQNLTVPELKTYISRLGENSKMVILGDIEQCDLDLRKHEKSGLEDAIERFKNMENVGIFEFDEDDIVRDKFLINIMKKYKY